MGPLDVKGRQSMTKGKALTTIVALAAFASVLASLGGGFFDGT